MNSLALKWNPLSYEKHFSNASPGSYCTWSLRIRTISWFSCCGVVSLLLWTTCATVISFCKKKKHTPHFKSISYWPQETVLVAVSWVLWHTASLKAYWLQPSVRALPSCDIALTEAYFHNILSGSTYLSTSRIPTPVLSLWEIYFLPVIQCVGKMYGDVISGFCIWQMVRGEHYGKNSKERAHMSLHYSTSKTYSELWKDECKINVIFVIIMFSILLLCVSLLCDSGGFVWQVLKRQIRVLWKCHKCELCANISSANVINAITVYEYTHKFPLWSKNIKTGL